MIRTIGLTKENKLVFDFPLEDIHTQSFKWYWVDLDQPDAKEELLLHSFFHFHPLAIEDCFHRLQRPKMDHYDEYIFFVLHSICHESLKAEEVNLFLGKNFVVTFHYTKVLELERARERIAQYPNEWEQGHVLITHQIIDEIIDDYFPILYKIEDNLNEIEDTLSPSTVHLSMDSVFDVRSNLLKLRRTILPMRELLHRMISSERLGLSTNERAYYSDIYDKLLRLGDILESNRELTADIRDSQLSINSNQMNRIMMILTIISSVFIPLTFIAGIYGMNFEVMPELKWRYSYPVVIIGMLIIGGTMLLWFKRKGWLRLFKS
ncbi:magnesium/cobalt transporter CorA [Sporosarcina sp. G11-34]|uniref:magnesium/cobalt transporter CorA n=1 Tax=Sporosarcina sp. G11-34 TaxID=2849605 RepID=UPI0022A9313E|nr:magnesium/cobalt transporter CorA [Sporosarcina sp. G11-34]MCZ2257786.1 magnesium/cobalt transporter CorA [Sporosarcina sp. G11-34]